MINETGERVHFPSSIEKKRVDGSVCGSDFLDPGEEILDASRTRAADAPSPPPAP